MAATLLRLRLLLIVFFPQDFNPYQIVLSAGEGFLPSGDEQKRLEHIDQRLRALLPPEDFESIASTPRNITPKQVTPIYTIGHVMLVASTEAAMLVSYFKSRHSNWVELSCTFRNPHCVHVTHHEAFNSLAPRGCCCNPELMIFKFRSRIQILSISCETNLRLMPQDLTEVYLALVQVMAWCHQVHQAITWARVDLNLRHHMVSLGHNELSLDDDDDTNILAKGSAAFKWKLHWHWLNCSC